MSRYGNLADDFYVNMHLTTEMDLPSNRETLLHYFELIQRRYPTMRNFSSRDRAEFMLEEEKTGGGYRWAAIEPRRVCSGHVNPDTIEDALEQHRLVLDQAPHALAVSPLDCESLNVMFCFDYTYRGNHNDLLREALGIIPALDRLCDIPGSRAIGYEPAIHLAFDEECRIQARVSIETRTTPFHIASGEFPEEQLTVYLTARRCGSLEPHGSFSAELDRLAELCQELADQYLTEQVLLPLQQAIAIK